MNRPVKSHGLRAVVALLRGCLLATIVSVIAPNVPLARADARTGYLVKLLKGSTQFRVRAQAALSLGAVGDSADAEEALKEALQDAHPAVRTAAAASLGRLGALSAIAQLERLVHDPEAPVRSAAQAALQAIQKDPSLPSSPPTKSDGPTRFYVAVGSTSSSAAPANTVHVQRARSYLRARLAELDGVELAPEQESVNQARKVLKARKLTGYILDASITSVQQRPGGGTRVAVSVILSSYPERDMRAILNGAATAVGSGESQNLQQALEGAFAGALKQLPQALGR